jgi:hypothetical protein
MVLPGVNAADKRRVNNTHRFVENLLVQSEISPAQTG